MEDRPMDQTTQLLILIIAAAVGVLSILVIQRRQQRDRAARDDESPYAASTEGAKRCPSCGMYNQWTDSRCISCGRALRG
jgi:hypothetical protein